jgi:hypothetical protein
MRTKLNCLYCKKDFYPIGGHLKQKYCSKECSYNSRKNKISPKKGKTYPHLQKQKKISNCLVCKKDFEAINDYKGREQKYCSKECWSNRGSLKMTKKCLNCNSIINYGRSSKIYCNRECAFKHKVGENATAYKDGKSLERQRGRDSQELKNWRKSVFKKDNYRCGHCKTNKNLQAHHIKSYADFPDLRFIISNGLTLCIDCHGKVHNRNFKEKRNKNCINCNADIVNKSKTGFCRSCAIKTTWKKRARNT